MTDFEQRLANLSPVPVDRDALLFVAGRASAPSPKWWKRSCGLLAATQLFTLGLFVVRQRPVSQAASTPTLPGEIVPAIPPAPSQPLDPSSYLALLRNWDKPRPRTVTPDDGDDHDTRLLTAGSRDL